MLRVSDNGFGTTRQSYPGVWFQGWRALLLGRLPRVIILQTLTSLGNRPAPARNVRHPDLSSASTPPRNRPARSFPVFCDLLESLNDTKVIPKASVGCVASTAYQTNGLFYGFAEVANWRAFQHFDQPGKSLKTVDATHPLFQIDGTRPGSLQANTANATLAAATIASAFGSSLGFRGPGEVGT